MSSPDKYQPPATAAGDYAHAGVRTLAGFIPIFGSAAVELLNLIMAPPLERRRSEWMDKVADGLRQLEAKAGVTIEQLQGNEAFVSTVAQASAAAIRTHQQEKIEALRNAVLNTALPSSLDDSLQQFFLGLVDTFTEWHLRILHLCNAPDDWFAARGCSAQILAAGKPGEIFEAAYPGLKGKREFAEQIHSDLKGRGLVDATLTLGGFGLGGRKGLAVTDLGRQFLQFISEPVALSAAGTSASR
jgi:hypothetical protein